MPSPNVIDAFLGSSDLLVRHAPCPDRGLGRMLIHRGEIPGDLDASQLRFGDGCRLHLPFLVAFPVRQKHGHVVVPVREVVVERSGRHAYVAAQSVDRETSVPGVGEDREARVDEVALGRPSSAGRCGRTDSGVCYVHDPIPTVTRSAGVSADRGAGGARSCGTDFAWATAALRVVRPSR